MGLQITSQRVEKERPSESRKGKSSRRDLVKVASIRRGGLGCTFQRCVRPGRDDREDCVLVFNAAQLANVDDDRSSLRRDVSDFEAGLAMESMEVRLLS
jgi:hypothetical protein